MNQFGTALLDFFFPPKCVFCGKLLQRGERGGCAHCIAVLPQNTRVAPISCAEDCRAPLIYSGPVKSAILKYKFGGRAEYASYLAEWMLPAVRSYDADCITWIPVSRIRMLERGYDQAKLLAERVAGLTGLPCIRLLKKKHTKRQSASPGREARFENVAGSFSAESSATGKRIILIDDICTTGATLSEASRVLIKAGAEMIFPVTLAMTDETKK